MNEWIFYGLPMYRANAGINPTAELPAIGTGLGQIADPYPGSGLSVAPIGGSTGLSETPVTTGSGKYYTASGGTIEVRGRAVSALAEIDITVPDGQGGLESVAGGVIITGLTSSEETPFPALIFNPIVDLGDGQNPLESTSDRFPVPDAVFPAGLTQIVDYVDGAGQLRQKLLLAATRFHPTGDGSVGVLEKFTDFEATVYYRDPNSPDTTPPLIRTAEGVTDGTIAFFEVVVDGDAGTPDDVQRVNVLFGPAQPTGTVQWRSIDLVRVGSSNRWVGGAPEDEAWDSNNFAFWVQAGDTTGNWGASTYKGDYFATTTAPGGTAVDIEVYKPSSTELATKSAGWYPGAVDAVASIADPLSGDLIDYYVLDGVKVELTDAATVTVPIAANGGHLLVVYPLSGSPRAALLAIDGAPPVPSHAIEPVPLENPVTTVGYNAVGAVVKLSAADLFGSGVAGINYTVDGVAGAITGPIGEIPIPDLDTGPVTVTYQAFDRVGNESDLVSLTVNIDATAPVVSATTGSGVSQGTTDGGWSMTSPVDVILSANDAEVGVVDTIEYAIVGGEWTTYDESFPIPDEGETTIAVRSTDALGNTADSANVIVKIDTVAPEVTISIPSGPYNQGDTVTASYQCTDVTSNVKSCEGSVGGVAIANGGAIDTSIVGDFTFKVVATDNAGYVTTATSDYSVKDDTPPVITLTGANPQTIEVGSAYTELGATATDNYDGDLTGLIVIDATLVNTTVIGSYTVTYDVTDSSDNAALQVSRTVDVVDTTAPSVDIDITADPAPTPEGWNAGAVTVTIEATDAGGVNTIEYSTDSGDSWVEYTDPFTWSDEGTTVILARATDFSGNTSEPTDITVKIDTTPPVITSTVPLIVSIGDSVVVDYTCTDPGEATGDGSGIASCTSDIGGSLDTSVPGTVSFTVTAVDNVSNTATQTFTVTVKYKVCYLYNENKPQPATGAVPIKIQLCDASGNNLSDSTIVLTATRVDDGAFALEPQDSGSSNSDPTFEFRWNDSLVGYIYNLNVDGIEAGDHVLHFTVSTTPGVEYSAVFKTK
jgi:hypothetical protein